MCEYFVQVFEDDSTWSFEDLQLLGLLSKSAAKSTTTFKQITGVGDDSDSDLDPAVLRTTVTNHSGLSFCGTAESQTHLRIIPSHVDWMCLTLDSSGYDV